jgi:excisionase family DNA binding protein
VDDIPADVLELARVLVASGLGAPREPEPPCADEPPHTVPEAAALMRVHESTIYRAIQDGALGAFSVGSGGRAIRIPAAELAAFKARRLNRRRATSEGAVA